jgi:hypothetical protein
LKEIIEIKELSYGEFSEISGLNPRFKPRGKKLKVVLDVNALGRKDLNVGLTYVFNNLVKLLPSLERHQCGENLFEHIRSGNLSGDHQHPDEITNIAHMMEHIIIDLQSNITGMNSCSGITCGYKKPVYRFDLFVECKDKKVGMFSAFFAAEILRRLVTNRRLSRRYPNLIDLTKHLYRERSHRQLAEPEHLVSQINQRWGWRRSFILLLLRKLKEFGFLD